MIQNLEFEIKDGLMREISNIILKSMLLAHNDRFLLKCRIRLIAELIEYEKDIRKDITLYPNWL